MGLEVATYIDDLVATNPLGSDEKRQGDDHIRLIKSVLNNSFNGANKTFSFPRMTPKSANYSVLDSDDNTIFECDTTGGAFTLLLPPLVLSQGGWRCYVIKSHVGVNPVFIQPPSGTIQGFNYVRRSSPFRATEVLWTGTIWTVSRPNGYLVGDVLDYRGNIVSPPDGFLACDGSVFSGVDYTELADVLLTTTLPNVPSRIICAE